MKILSTKPLTIMRAWFKKALNIIGAFSPSFQKSMNHIKALSILFKNLIFIFVRQNIFRVNGWFKKNKQNFVNFLISIPVIVLIYFIPYTFLLGSKERTIVGVILQILAGAILIFDQISSNIGVRKQVTKIIQKPLAFAFLLTIILLPFAISVLTGLGEVPSDRWSTAGGITFFVFITYGMFLSSLMFLRRIKWLRSKDYVQGEKNKFDVSDLSLPNVGILFGISLLVAILLGYLLQNFSSNKEFWVQIPLYAFTFFYIFTVFPLLIISPLYFLAFAFAKIVFYIRTKKNLGIWFWIFLFVLWAWGGLLLIIKEFK
jgi:hypothetical protein